MNWHGDFTGDEMAAAMPERRCPDEGKCWHWCVTGCFRVACCAPFTNYYTPNGWPAEVVEEFGKPTYPSDYKEDNINE